MKILAFLVITVLAKSATGQTEAGDPILDLQFRLKAKVVCIGETIDLEARIVNVSNSDAVVDTRRIGSLVSLQSLVRNSHGTGPDSFLANSGVPNNYEPRFIRLRPTEAFSAKLNFRFEREDFPDAGRYKMEIGYEQTVERDYKGVSAWKGMIYSTEAHPIRVKECAK